MKYGACSLPSGAAVIETGGRQAFGFASAEAQESHPSRNQSESLDWPQRLLPAALLGTPGAMENATDGTQQAPLKRVHVRRIYAEEIGDASRQQIAKEAEAGAGITVFGLICHAIAILGCKMASGVESKQCFRYWFGSEAFNGWLMSCEIDAKDPAAVPRHRADSADWNCGWP